MRIVDGDTVKLGGTSYRLAGIDAPENGQTATDARGRRFDAGAAATEALSRYLAAMDAQGWQVDIVCHSGDVDRYGRQLGHIELVHRDGRTLDVCAWMVAEGWAVAEYGAQYRHLERDARRHCRGLWAGDFERPKDWRRARRSRSRAPAQPAPSPEKFRWLWSLILALGGVLVVLLVFSIALARESGRRRRRRYW